MLRANVRALLEEAEAVDAEEDERYGPDRRGDELPEELQRREQRLAKIREAKQALEEEARAAETARRAELESDGRKPRRPPNGRDPFKPKPKAQRNFTDPESKIMKTADGAFHQCYNGQALVDSKAQVIVAADLSDEAPDARQLAPALDQLADNLAAVGAELARGRHAEPPMPATSPRTTSGSPASTGSTRTSPPGASNTPSRRRPRRAGRSRRTRRPNSGWRAS